MTESWLLDLSDVLKAGSANPSLSSLVSDWNGRPLVVYGAGPAGKCVCDILLRLDVKPECILDGRADRLPSCYAGIPILSLKQCDFTQAWKRDAVVLVCVVQGIQTHTAIAKNLVHEGFRTIIPWIQKAFSSDAMRTSGRVEPRLENFQDSIMSCAELLEDSLSRETYLSLMTACVLRRFDELRFIDPEEQYFPSDIDMNKGYQSFMDCGAFRGDTLDRLVGKVGFPSTYIAFEPDSRNFSDLVRRVEELNIKRALLFPCGVSRTTKPYRFAIDQIHEGAGSSLDPTGEDLVQCVAIDECLKGIDPTFIKIDIEGNEIEALIGAKRTIERCLPDLAVAIYHYADHYFEIINLLHRWNLGYRFNMRTYDRFGNETILYATCRSSSETV